MLNVFWDIDGVLRDLCGIVWGSEPEEWTNEFKGINIYDFVKLKDYRPLVEAESFEFIQVARSMPEVFILSCQPVEWRKYTEEWLKRNFSDNRLFLCFVEEIEEKINFLNKAKDFFLIDDYPFFSDYSKVILIDKLYNRIVENPFKRVYNIDDLKEVIFE